MFYQHPVSEIEVWFLLGARECTGLVMRRRGSHVFEVTGLYRRESEGDPYDGHGSLCRRGRLPKQGSAPLAMPCGLAPERAGS